MDKRIRVAILFGGRSAEHEISLLSAQNVVRSLDRKKYEPVLIGIDKSGKWFYQADSLSLMYKDDPGKIALSDDGQPVLFSQNTGDHYIKAISKADAEPLGKIDVLFPVLHGTYGEDGAIQGLAKLANIPCVGAGILGSAVGMDKEVMKRLLRDAQIPIADFVTIRRRNRTDFIYSKLSEQLGEILFVKPANLGSSVGISRVATEGEFDEAVALAFQFDNKVIVESRIAGREIECAVMGNDVVETSIPGEIIPKGGFYSYEAKYLDEHGAVLVVPAKLTTDEEVAVRRLAKQTYELLECTGMARVDLFLCPDGRMYVNEINTIPGFTNISMFPRLWELSGKSNTELVDQLVQLAIENHKRQNALKVSVVD